jgi:hypothetical protein
MQFLPTAADLAGAIARLLDEQVVGAVPPELQHPVRVAGHLAKLLERESRLGAAAAEREAQLLGELLGTAAGDRDELSAAVAARIGSGGDDDESEEFERLAWHTLVEITRADVAIAKPGHDSWRGE